MKKFIQEFKEFAIQGNAFDLAVGVVIGGAFGSIIKAIIEGLIDPLISLIVPAESLNTWVITLVDGKSGIGIGLILNAIITFTMTAFIIFLMVKGVNAIRARANAKKEVEEVVDEVIQTKEEILLAEILEELKKNNTK